MTTKIQTKPFNYGNEKESEWPSRFPKSKKGYHCYWDKEKQELVEGYPSPTPKLGVAPMYISDCMDETVHPKTGEVTASRKRWAEIDKANGCFTTGSFEETGSKKRKKDTKKEDVELIDTIRKAKAGLENGSIKPPEPKPLPDSVKKEIKKQSEVALKGIK